jgi:hypothetical protein
MAQAKSISLKHFTSTVQAAVKTAVQKHPKFKVNTPQGVVFSYLIRGIPFAEEVLQTVTLGETQAYANELASHIGGKPEGAVYFTGGHLILGIPTIDNQVIEE